MQSTYDTEPGSQTIAATFPDRDRAHEAIRALHDEGFGHTWLGIIAASDVAGEGTAEPADEQRVEADNWFARLFGEGDQSLHDALVRHGVAEAELRSVRALPPQSAIVTVDGVNEPQLAAQIITQNGGDIIAGGDSYATGAATTSYGAAGSGRTVGQATRSGFADPSVGIPSGLSPDPLGEAGSKVSSRNNEAMGTLYGSSTQAADAEMAKRQPFLDRDKPDPGTPAVTAMGTGSAERYVNNPLLSSEHEERRAQMRSEAALTGNTMAEGTLLGRPSGEGGDVGGDTDLVDTGNVGAYGTRARDTAVRATDESDAGNVRSGSAGIEDERRIQLREERMRINKQRISAGEAVIGTRVVTETHQIDVPLVREELFVMRKPAGGQAGRSAAPIGDETDVMRIPLSEEKIEIEKTPVVREDVIVGKRSVTGTEHVSETTRREELEVEERGMRSGGTKSRS